MHRPIEISICIPAYKNTVFLKRLLDSISEQTFTDYEIIVTDDSPDDSVKNLVAAYPVQQPLYYYKNEPVLGTPENWNESIRRANGNWIKLMHNDDWFATKDALQIFFDATTQYPGLSFFFAAFRNIIVEPGKSEVVRCNSADLLFLRLSTLHLFRRVYVGNPSCTLVRRDINLYYDRQFKFVVDFEFYIRCFRQLKNYKYLDDVLLNIGFHDEQVTKYTFLVPEVQLPENIIMLKKFGLRILRNPVVYDYYWRMFRNLGTRNVEQVRQYYKDELPSLLRQMIKTQSMIPRKTLRNGIISKGFMMLNYLVSLFSAH